MNRTLISLGLAMGLLLPATTALAAKTVYRCQDGGRIIYADEPCASGRSRELLVDDSQSAVSDKEARELAQRNAAKAKAQAAKSATAKRVSAANASKRPASTAPKPKAAAKKPVKGSQASNASKRQREQQDQSMKKVESLMDAASASMRSKP